MAFTDKIFKRIENKTNVDKETILSLAGKLENGNMKNEETIKEIKSAGEKTTKEIRSKFLQWWYETLEEKEVRWFWKEFIKINQVAYVL